MTDEVDRAQTEEDSALAEARYRARAGTQAYACGVCNNCDAAVSLSQKFCDTECAQEWDKWARSPALKRRD